MLRVQIENIVCISFTSVVVRSDQNQFVCLSTETKRTISSRNSQSCSMTTRTSWHVWRRRKMHQNEMDWLSDTSNVVKLQTIIENVGTNLKKLKSKCVVHCFSDFFVIFPCLSQWQCFVHQNNKIFVSSFPFQVKFSISFRVNDEPKWPELNSLCLFISMRCFIIATGKKIKALK